MNNATVIIKSSSIGGLKMEFEISWIGALFGLALAIGLILLKLAPTYALILGAIVGAFVGDANFTETVTILTQDFKVLWGRLLYYCCRCFCWCYDGIWSSGTDCPSHCR